MMPVSYIGAGSPAFAPPDLLPTFPHPALCFRRLTQFIRVKHSLPWLFWGQPVGAMGRDRKGQRINTSSSLLPDRFGKDCNPLSKATDCLAPSLLATVLTGVGNQPLSWGPLGLRAC